MNKLLKRLSVVLLLAVIISLLPVGSIVKAAKMKQTGSSWLYEGQKQKITLRINYKSIKPKKIKWSSSNKKVATVNKKGVATAKKKGTAKIIMKYKGKKYYHKLTVKRRNNVNPTTAATPTPIPNNELAMNIAVKAEQIASGDILYTVTNNNSIGIYNVKLSVMYFDASGMPVTTEQTSIYDIASGETLYESPYISSTNLAKIDMTKTQISISVINDYTSSKKYITQSLQLTGTIGEDNKLFLTIVNPNSQKVYIDGIIFYRDAANNIVATKEIYKGIEPGATIFEEYSSPYYRMSIEGVHSTLDKVPFVTADWIYREYYYSY